MQITVNRDDIIQVLANVQGLTNRKSNLAITSNVLIRTDNEGVRITATDLETGFEGSYPAVVDREGAVTINARKLFEIVRDFPDQEIKLEEIKNGAVEIGGGKVTYHILSLNPDEFPDSPNIDDVRYFDMDGGHFKKMIDKTVGITGESDDNRAHIIGNCLEKVQEGEQNIVRMVATDGGRLSKMDCVFGESIDLPLDNPVLIPKKGLIEVSKFIKRDGIVQLGVKDNKFVVKQERETFIVRLLEGVFPDYSKVVWRDLQSDILVPKNPFFMMIKRMSILSTDTYRAVKFRFEEDCLHIDSTNPEIGDSKEHMEIEFKRKPLEMAFNPRYFIDALNVIDEENVILNISNESRPCLIEAENDKSYLGAIMPMQV
jgi:DNA polymerase-3 subunit beta